MMRLIDTHCHFDDPQFDVDRSELVTDIKAKGVTDVIFPAIAANYWERLRSITSENSTFHASYGLHPMFLDQHTDEHLGLLKQWLEREHPVAVGECGLDFFVPGLDQSRQLHLFQVQLKLAKEFDLPVIIHARKSLDLVLKQIRQLGGLRGVIHSFSGSLQQAEQLIAQGFYLGIGGTVTYERAQRLRRVVAEVPEQALLLETDAPDQPDSEWRGRRNEPGRLVVIAETVAGLRETSLENIAQVTTGNAQRLFNIC